MKRMIACCYGTQERDLISGFEWLIHWRASKGGNPYGDGKAAERVAKIIDEKL